MTTRHTGLRTGEVARLLDVPEHRIANRIRFRLIAAPRIVAGRRLWSPAEVAAARRVLVARGVISAPTAEPSRRRSL